jgi:uncharacterized Zn finger protein
MGWGSYGGFGPYISKAEKIERAEKVKIKLMKKKGVILEPITLETQVIARTWWGKSWNSNLERYADFQYRLGRGRSYVRCGSVIDLKIIANEINALVMGSDSSPYTIKVKIDKLDSQSQGYLMEKSRTSLDSMHSLLTGEFPADLKDEFFKQGTGLFPTPKELHFNCSCPDIAKMCKHVAAAMYGVSARLDQKPELFFLLRGININDFVNTMIEKEREKILTRAKTKSLRSIDADTDEISELFGIDVDDNSSDLQIIIPVKKPAKGSSKKSVKKTIEKLKEVVPVKKPVVKKTVEKVAKKKKREI